MAKRLTKGSEKEAKPPQDSPLALLPSGIVPLLLQPLAPLKYALLRVPLRSFFPFPFPPACVGFRLPLSLSLSGVQLQDEADHIEGISWVSLCVRVAT